MTIFSSQFIRAGSVGTFSSVLPSVCCWLFIIFIVYCLLIILFSVCKLFLIYSLSIIVYQSWQKEDLLQCATLCNHRQSQGSACNGFRWECDNVTMWMLTNELMLLVLVEDRGMWMSQVHRADPDVRPDGRCEQGWLPQGLRWASSIQSSHS